MVVVVLIMFMMVVIAAMGIVLTANATGARATFLLLVHTNVRMIVRRFRRR